MKSITEIKSVTDKIISDSEIRNLFRIRNLEHGKEENFYKPARVGNFWSDNYVKYKRNGDTNKTLPVEEYLNKTNHT